MATFKAVVQQHQQRRDGSYPVSIRVTNNRKSFYLPTGLYCSQSQIHRKTFEIKDQFILTRVVSTIRDYQQRLLTVHTTNLSEMSTQELKKILTESAENIDYMGYCEKLIAEDALKWRDLRLALTIVREMGITTMSVMDFNSSFIRRFRMFLDSKNIPVMHKGVVIGHRNYAPNTKHNYMLALCKVFRLLQLNYNSEFHKVIYHDPFIGFKNYSMATIHKNCISVDRLRVFFNLKARTKKQQTIIDLMKLSFCLCGMNLLDILSVQKSSFDKKTMRITYNRHKTKDHRADHALISVRVEPEIVDLIYKYRAPADSDLLFKFENFTDTYVSTSRISNRTTTTCVSLGFETVTPYYFRHSWATIARNDCDISKDDIDLCLAHAGQNPMADVYITPDWSRIDRANRKVLDFVFHQDQNTIN